MVVNKSGVIPESSLQPNQGPSGPPSVDMAASLKTHGRFSVV